jgi:hypothetical protein
MVTLLAISQALAKARKQAEASAGEDNSSSQPLSSSGADALQQTAPIKPAAPRTQRPDITTPTRGEFRGLPTRFPIHLSLTQWRIVLANIAVVREFCEDFKDWTGDAGR